ncbi:alpha/beta fold hydrolase [Parasphingorhabdus pacifica]
MPDVGPPAVERVERICGTDLHYWVYREELLDAAGPRGGGRQPPPIVMIHGLRGTHEGLELIVDRLPGRCVVVPDMPGFGESGPMPDRTHDVAGYANVVEGILKLLGAQDRPVFLLGHSFGSVIAAHVAATVPAFVRRLVLINPIASPPLNGPRVVLTGLTSAYYALGNALPPRLGTALLSNKLAVFVASRAMMRSKDKRIRQYVYDSHLRHFSRFHSPELLSQTYEASVTRTVANYVDRLRVPTLLIAGESDEIAPLDGQRELLSGIVDAELVVIPEVGHLVHYETPGAAAEAVDRFLAARQEDAGAQA